MALMQNTSGLRNVSSAVKEMNKMRNKNEARWQYSCALHWGTFLPWSRGWKPVTMHLFGATTFTILVEFFKIFSLLFLIAVYLQNVKSASWLWLHNNALQNSTLSLQLSKNNKPDPGLNIQPNCQNWAMWFFIEQLNFSSKL